MAKCRWCDKGGLFQKTNKEGLCKACAPEVLADIEGKSNLIYELMHVIERSQDPQERLSECDRLLEAAEALTRYEDKGLETCSPPAKLVLDEYRGFREEWAAGA